MTESALLDAAVAIAIVLVIAGVIAAWFRGKPIAATRESGERALGRLTEWAKWMSGIQTATLAALGFMLNHRDRWSAGESFTAIATVVLMGSALLCTGWVLSSIANVGLAISRETVEDRDILFDVYERHLYARFAELPAGHPLRHLTLNYMVTLQHWLWASGLIFFGIFLLTQVNV